MTESQKAQIRAMRMNGIGYRTIAKSLGLKVNQVQLFGKAHGLAGPAELTRMNYPIWCRKNNRCPICGTKKTQPVTGRRRKFCSGRCRTRYYRERRNENDDSNSEPDIHDDNYPDPCNLDRFDHQA